MPLYDDALAWLCLARAPALDAPTLLAAIERLGSARGVLTATDAAREQAGIPPAARAFLRGSHAVASDREMRWLEGPRHHLLPFNDARYPTLLRDSPGCPLVLYVAGTLAALEDPQLAVVGSRNPTPQGRDTAFAFAHSLALRGLGITSGLAAGIDSAAHRGALAASGVTLAVLGSGVDVIYPRANGPLSEAVAAQGALLSEFPLGTPPRKGNFPRRNHTIAGLCLGTLVVEAARRSGSLLTARSANELGREVFAIPGSIQNPLARGCHALIQAGGKLTETPDDILRDLNFSAFFGAAAGARDTANPPARVEAGMDKDHKILLDALGFDPADLDMLIVRTGFKPETVSSMMLMLELEGYVQAAPGGRYSRVAHRRAGGER